MPAVLEGQAVPIDPDDVTDKLPSESEYAVRYAMQRAYDHFNAADTRIPKYIPATKVASAKDVLSPQEHQAYLDTWASRQRAAKPARERVLVDAEIRSDLGAIIKSEINKRRAPRIEIVPPPKPPFYGLRVFMAMTRLYCRRVARALRSTLAAGLRFVFRFGR